MHVGRCAGRLLAAGGIRGEPGVGDIRSGGEGDIRPPSDPLCAASAYFFIRGGGHSSPLRPPLRSGVVGGACRPWFHGILLISRYIRRVMDMRSGVVGGACRPLVPRYPTHFPLHRRVVDMRSGVTGGACRPLLYICANDDALQRDALN
jgi:hypothetical protein